MAVSGSRSAFSTSSNGRTAGFGPPGKKKKRMLTKKIRCHWKKLGQFNEDNIQVLGN